MLLNLIIKNFAIIDDLFIKFDGKMNIITGESGSGKSIIIQALNLVLGARADKSMIKVNAKATQITADFRPNKIALNFLNKNQIDDEDNCILRRTINNDGRSKAFINDTPVSLDLLQQLATLLIDIHGQNQHQFLLQENYQLQLLDGYANNYNLCSQIEKIAAQINELSKNINDIENNNLKKSQRLELLSYQLNELQDANLELNELQTIENKYKIISNLEQLVSDVSMVDNSINNNIADELNKSINILTANCKIDNKLQEILDMLISAQVNISECSYDLNNYLNAVNFDMQNSTEVAERLSQLHNLSRKHNCQISNLIDVENNISREVDDINNSSISLKKLQQNYQELINDYKKLTSELTIKRKNFAKKLTKEVQQIMSELGMQGSKFIISFIDNKEISRLGCEKVEFLITTNNMSSPKPLKKIASGGELSRISLAISVATTSNAYASCLVFDEVDVGISGKIASVVAKKLQILATKYQIICITHLPQVAAVGSYHLLIIKDDNLLTNIIYLSPQHKQQEIARMLGGGNISDKTLAAAKEIIDNAK